ncbi:MAG TPA: LamG domain-containing protein, partial [Verrucomicrobiae bacterium]|nr:LamG domain-containing protein [Verrucomicrobiae bacterium]
LTPQNGTTRTLRYAITTASNGGEQQINCNSTLTTGNWHQVAVTLSAITGILYLDGAPVGTNIAMTLNPSSLGRTSNNYLGKSQWPDPYLDGQIDEFRIYSVALSASEIAATYALGPDELLSTNSPPINMEMTSSGFMLSWPLASAGFTLQSRTNLTEGNWVNVTSPIPVIVGSRWQFVIPASSDSNSMFYRLIK